jgi:hypothetical protein
LGAGNVLARALKYKVAEENYLNVFDLSAYPVLFYSSAFISTVLHDIQVTTPNVTDIYEPLYTILTAQNI